MGLKGCGQEDEVEVLGCFGEECKSVRVVEVSKTEQEEQEAGVEVSPTPFPRISG